jgi:hypothetical protein
LRKERPVEALLGLNAVEEPVERINAHPSVNPNRSTPEWIDVPPVYEQTTEAAEQLLVMISYDMSTTVYRVFPEEHLGSRLDALAREDRALVQTLGRGGSRITPSIHTKPHWTNRETRIHLSSPLESNVT